MSERRSLTDRLYWKLRGDPEWNGIYDELKTLIEDRDKLAELAKAVLKEFDEAKQKLDESFGMNELFAKSTLPAVVALSAELENEE